MSEIIRTRRRKPWIAAILSLLIPGLGQAYAGHAKRGLLVYVLLQFCVLVFVLILTQLPFGIYSIFSFIILVVSRVLIVIDAMLVANKAATPFELRPYNKWYIYLLAFVVVAFADPSSLLAEVSVNAARVSTASMEDTLLLGDRIFINKLAYGISNPFTVQQITEVSEPRRGDVVIIKFPDDPDVTYVYRVIGLPGDRLEIKQKKVYINGQVLDEGYIKYGDEVISPDWKDFDLIAIPYKHVFVMGDNRDNSNDSRYRGTVPQANVLGRVEGIYWSRDPTSEQVRWARIGQGIQ